MAERPQGHAPQTTARARRRALSRDADGRAPWYGRVVGGCVVVPVEAALLGRSAAQCVGGLLTQAAGRADCQASHHAELVPARWEGGAGVLRVELRDARDGREAELRTRCVVNAAGVWA